MQRKVTQENSSALKALPMDVTFTNTCEVSLCPSERLNLLANVHNSYAVYFYYGSCGCLGSDVKYTSQASEVGTVNQSMYAPKKGWVTKYNYAPNKQPCT